MADEPKEVAVTGGLAYLAYGISIIVASTALIGCFSFAWQVSLQLNTVTQEVKSLASVVAELKKDHEDSKEDYAERIDRLIRPAR